MDGQNRAAFTSAPCSLHRRTGSTYTVRPHGKFHGALLLLFTNNQQGAAAVR